MGNHTNKYFLLTLWCLFASGTFFSQPIVDKEKIEKEFPGEALVYNTYETTLEFILDHGKPAILMHEYQEFYYVTDKNTRYNQHAIRYSPSFEKDIETKAISYIPDEKGNFKKVKINKYSKSQSVSTGIFYDDNEEIEYVYPGITVGSVASLDYQCKIIDPIFIPSIYFNRHLPSVNSKATIIVPDGIQVRFLIYGDSAGIAKSVIRKKDKTIYTYEKPYGKKIDYEDDGPSLKHYVPHLIVIPESYQNGTDKVAVLGSIDDLFKTYNDYVSSINLNAGQELKSLADSLTRNYTDTLDKVKSIYYWVQKNIDYVAFEDGMGGFIPREADAVYKKRYGDCKDKTSIIVQMLKLSGLPGYYTWIGTRDIPYSYYEVPTPICDNHMIAATKVNGQWIFLDGTSTYLKFGLPTYSIQNKEALIRMDQDHYIIQKVPIVNKDINKQKDSIRINIKDGIIYGTGETTFSGFYKEYFNDRYNAARKDNKEDVVSSWVKTGNNKFKLTDKSVAGVDNNDTDIDIKYSFELPSYITTVDDQIFINMNLDKSFSTGKLDIEKRKVAKQYKHLFNVEQTISFDLNNQFILEKIPENAQYHSESFGFNINYRVENQKIIMTKYLYMNELLITQDMFEEYNAMIDKINKAYKGVVVIKKKN